MRTSTSPGPATDQVRHPPSRQYRQDEALPRRHRQIEPSLSANRLPASLANEAEAADQLVHGLRGPAENVHILATAYSNKEKKGTGEHELMIWTVEYGKGRIFHTPMGHDLTSLRCVGLTTVLLRGTEWVATGKVTLPIPKEFPKEDKTSSYPGK